MTRGQRSDLAEAQPTTHSARAEVLWKTGGWTETGGRRDFPSTGSCFLVGTHFASSGGLWRAGIGGSQRHPAARGSPSVARGGERGFRPSPCTSPGTLVFPPGSGASRGGRDPLRVYRAGGEGQAGGWQPTVFCFLTPDMLRL